MSVNRFYFENNEEKLAHLKGLEKIPGIKPLAYAESKSYQRLDYILHDVFGVGVVEEVMDRRTIKVFFPGGSQVLKQRQYS